MVLTMAFRGAFAYVASVTGGRWSRTRTRARCLAGVLLALTGASRATSAAPASTNQPQPFRLVWSSSAGCRDAQSFPAELTGRTPLLRQAEADEHALTLIVETFPSDGGVRGRLTVRKLDGDLTVREVPGLDCHEVESAMALIAALMVDPAAGSAERSRPDITAKSKPLKESAPAAPAARRWSIGLEQRLTARTAVAPGLTWGQAARISLTREAADLRPSVGLSAHSARATTSQATGAAELEWVAGQLELCPASLQLGVSWDLRACVALQLGRLRGVGFQTVSPATKAVLWSAAGGEVEVRYGIARPLWIGIEGALVAPFSHDRFYLEPESTLHRVPAVGLSFGAGLGLRFF